jgi:hypothetical protein
MLHSWLHTTHCLCVLLWLVLQIDEAMGRLAAALQAHGVNLELSR